MMGDNAMFEGASVENAFASADVVVVDPTSSASKETSIAAVIKTKTTTAGGDQQLRVASLNFWGLKYLAPKRQERLDLLIKHIKERTDAERIDVLCLQEIWVKKDYQYLKRSLQKHLPHSFYFKSGLIGSGIVTFSAWEIESTFWKRFTLCGSPERFWHGDFFTGKGVGGVRLRIPDGNGDNGEYVDIYNTHLHAEYNFHRDSYIAHRITQWQELAEFVEDSSLPSHVTIIAGDLNTEEKEIPYRMVIGEDCCSRYQDSQLYDGWKLLHGDSDSFSGSNNADGSNAIAAETTNTTTDTAATDIDDGHTTHRKGNEFKKKIGRRLDYFLFPKKTFFSLKRMTVIDDKGPRSTSDHSMIEAVFVVHKGIFSSHKKETAYTNHQAKKIHPLPENTIKIIREALEILLKKRANVIFWQKFHFWTGIICLVIFFGLVITTAITIPGDNLTTLLILAFFAVMPIAIATAMLCLMHSLGFLQEEHTSLSSFIRHWNMFISIDEKVDLSRFSAATTTANGNGNGGVRRLDGGRVNGDGGDSGFSTTP